LEGLNPGPTQMGKKSFRRPKHSIIEEEEEEEEEISFIY
jgi:hypothetical protein